MRKVTLFKGDGIGQEICESVKEVFEALNIDIEFEEYDVGLNLYEKTGELISQEALESIKRNKVILKAPITTPIAKGFRSINVTLREQYNLYINMRPVKSLPNIITPFKNIDLIIFRENTEDLYVGKEEIIDDNTVHALKIITKDASTKIIKAAFEYALKHNRKKVSCIHKANILKLSDGMFLSIFNEIKQQYPTIESNDYIVDNACMQLVMHPEIFDVMVMPNLYGDILSDLASGLIGGLGFLPSANIGDEVMMFEAVHGSALDIAGKNIANPIALLLSACLMLDYLKDHQNASYIRKAIELVLKEGKVKTQDFGGSASTSELTQAIIDKLKEIIK